MIFNLEICSQVVGSMCLKRSA